MSKKLQTRRSGRRKGLLKPSELSVFCAQISMFMHSGVTLAEGLSLLGEDAESGALKQAVDAVGQRVQNRDSLSGAMREAGVFPPYLIRMAEIGELSGRLEQILSMLAGYYERELQRRREIAGAVVYPAALAVLMTAVVVLLIVRVLPVFEALLVSLGGAMPPVAASLLAGGRFLEKNWPAFFIGLAAAAAAVLILRKNPAFAAGWDRLLAGFAPTRGIVQKIAAERFAAAMAFLLQSGIDTDTALELSARIIGNGYLADRIEKARIIVQSGRPLSDAVGEAGIFPRLFVRMLSVGIKTGETDKAMENLTEIYRKEADHSLKKLIGMIEPALIALLSALVGIILISVMLPMVGIMGAI